MRASILSPGVIENTEWRWVFVTGTILLALLLAPFLWAYAAGVPESHFMGVLVNPIDGASYQAKMQQGVAGSWLFRLPYTPEVHDGVFLYTFYLGLGHLARLLNQAPILVFHTARLIGAMLMFMAYYRLVADCTDDLRQRRLSWLIGVLGAGFGWVALLFGRVTPDMLILPEAFPLQAAYANPHFPWALACGLVIAHILLAKFIDEQDNRPDLNIETVALAAATLILASTSPFMLITLGVAFAALFVWAWRRWGALPRRQLAWGLVVVIFALPLVAYGLWAVSGANPVFQAWMRQNMTSSPPLWDYLIAFGPHLALATIGVWGLRRRLQAHDIFLLGWLLSALALLYAPVGLQRRFAMGLLFPLGIYAGLGLWRVVLPRLAERWKLLCVTLAFLVFLPTTFVALLAPALGSQQLVREGGGLYYASGAELRGMHWLRANTPGALVLAAPETSLFLPAYGVRVVYGHPFETLNAEARHRRVRDFYAGADCDLLADESVDYVWVGPRERAQMDAGEACLPGGEPVFQSSGGRVVLYAAHGG